MKGRLSKYKWYVYRLDFNYYEAQRTVNGILETWYGNAHCLACAKSDLLAERGGRVDLRGWHLTTCGVFMKVMQKEIISEDD